MLSLLLGVFLHIFKRLRGRGRGKENRRQTRPKKGLRFLVVLVFRGMQTSDGWCKSCVVWAIWMLYICFAMALTLGRSDGPSGQGFSSLRVESLLSKMTLEDKVGSVVLCSSFFVLCLHSAARWLIVFSHLSGVFHPIFDRQRKYLQQSVPVLQ